MVKCSTQGRERVTQLHQKPYICECMRRLSTKRTPTLFYCDQLATLFYTFDEGERMGFAARCAIHPMNDKTHPSLNPKLISFKEFEQLKVICCVMGA